MCNNFSTFACRLVLFQLVLAVRASLVDAHRPCRIIRLASEELLHIGGERRAVTGRPVRGEHISSISSAIVLDVNPVEVRLGGGLLRCGTASDVAQPA
jgi:hypothetical protein